MRSAECWPVILAAAVFASACGRGAGLHSPPAKDAELGGPELDGGDVGPAARYALTVSFEGSGAGTVAIQPGGTLCTAPESCTETFASGTDVILTAKPSSAGATVNSMLTGWTGACAANGPYRFCSLRIGAAVSTAARFDVPPANLAFVTSASFPGNLGSALAYQSQCNQLAAAAGINNAANDAYVAWLAASDYAPGALLGSTRGWVRADLLPWIDSMAAALDAGAVYYPLAYDENGQRVIADTLSGMTGTGGPYFGENCGDWTDATMDTSRGSTHAGGKGWAYNNVGVSPCGLPSRVLCVMKGANTPVSVTPVAGKRIYLSRSAWVPGGGLAAADAKCLAEAPASVKAAKAVLVASTRALTDVLDVSAVYVRPDGVRAGTGAEIIQALIDVPPATIEGAVTQDGGGKYVDTTIAQLVWTGLDYWTGAGDSATCRDWTSAQPADTGTGGCVAAGWEDAGKCGGFPCNNDPPVIFLQCAEQ